MQGIAHEATVGVDHAEAQSFLLFRFAPEEQLGAFIDMERVDLLSRGLEKLPQRDRDILMYRYILEMSDEEIAGLLNIKPGSVRMCLSRARKNAFAVLEAEEMLI